MRITLEEAAWELFKNKGNEILDILDLQSRDIVQRAWGLGPYKQHTIRMIAKQIGIPRSTVHYRYRKSLKTIKKIYNITITCL